MFTKTYTRLRRNPGFNLVSEKSDIGAEANKTYRIEILVIGHHIQCFINGQRVHIYQDPDRYRSGKLAFRSWHTRLWHDNLRVYRIEQ